jgi:hypothetical protein
MQYRWSAMKWSASLVSVAALWAAFGCSSDDVVARRNVGAADAHAAADARAPGTDGRSIVADAAAGAGGQAPFTSDGALPTETDDAHVPGDGTPVHGTLDGHSIDVVDGYSVVYSVDELTFLRITTVNFADACSTQLMMSRSGMYHRSSRGVYLSIAVTGSVVSPGTYKINASSITSPFLTQPDPTVYVGYAANDDQCVVQNTDALFGTVVIEQVDGQHVTGAFDVTFAHGHMSGAFDTPRCDVLVQRVESDAGTPDAGVPDASAAGCFP